MKVAVVGSNGRVGSLVVKELLERNYDVVSIAKEETEGVKTLIKDALDLTKEDLNSFDVVIDAVGGWTPETIHNITDVMNHLADLLESSNTRLIVYMLTKKEQLLSIWVKIFRIPGNHYLTLMVKA